METVALRLSEEEYAKLADTEKQYYMREYDILDDKWIYKRLKAPIVEETLSKRLDKWGYEVSHAKFQTMPEDLKPFWVYRLSNDDYIRATPEQYNKNLGPVAIPAPSEVANTLKERGSRYGSFIDHATITQELLAVIMAKPGYARFQADAKNSVFMIFDKIARAINGDPEYDDNWRDIAGYATLILNRITDDKKKEPDLFSPAPSLSSQERIGEDDQD